MTCILNKREMIRTGHSMDDPDALKTRVSYTVSENMSADRKT
jgi:hypothetical protein